MHLICVNMGFHNNGEQKFMGIFIFSSCMTEDLLLLLYFSLFVLLLLLFVQNMMHFRYAHRIVLLLSFKQFRSTRFRNNLSLGKLYVRYVSSAYHMM